MTYDAILLDLDGVVYRSKTAIPGAVEALNTWQSDATPYAFITNNAARDVSEIAQTIRSYGVACSPDQVRTAAQAAAEKLAGDIDRTSTVLVLGSEFLRTCLDSQGFTVITPRDTQWLTAHTPVAVVQGFGPETSWWDLSWAITAVRNGALYRPTNPDRCIPTARGLMPGNGTFVDIVARFADTTIEFAGKPQPTMLHQAAAHLNAKRPLMVGDQLDTDIQAAVAAGMDSVLVLTGVTTCEQALAAPAHKRPTRIASRLTDVLTPMPEVAVTADGAQCGGARVTIRDGAVSHSGDPLLAANAALAWTHAHDRALMLGTLKGLL